jgi:hypothetical protein
MNFCRNSRVSIFIAVQLLAKTMLIPGVEFHLLKGKSYFSY